jgi:formate dehydrogenase subunit beta
MSERALLDLKHLRRVVSDALIRTDGVVALRADHSGAVPHLFKPGDDLADLVITPRYPMAMILDTLGDAWPKARLGLVARGCDERALVELVKRNQINQDNVEILGFACSAEQAIECRCAKPYPDALVAGEAVEGVAEDPRLAEMEAMAYEERFAFWSAQYAKCLKCYGCRNFCPVCYCPTCALESDLWVESGVLAPPFPSYHMIKAMHMVGRCIACRECETICPADIPLTTIYSLLQRDTTEMFDYVAGRSVDEKPPLLLSLRGTMVD